MKSVTYIKRANIDDLTGFNQLVSSCGGQPLLRSTFGQFNFPSLVEYSYLNIIAGTEKGAIGYASFNDGGLAGQETESFDDLLDEIRTILPTVQVYFCFSHIILYLVAFVIVFIFFCSVLVDFQHFVSELLGH